MKLYNDSPNFSIVLPGCNASCAFCFNKGKKLKAAPEKIYLKNLEVVLDNLPPQFYQISITGGEPLISPLLSKVLRLVAMRRKQFTNVVLTTNGTNLEAKAELLGVAIDHVNVSRHNVDDCKNRKVFGGLYNVLTHQLQAGISACNKQGLDVCLNCVADDRLDKVSVLGYLEYARKVGAESVSFRKIAGKVGPFAVEKDFAEYRVVAESSCPVCRSATQLIRGLRVSWKSSAIEPSKDLGSVYELVFDVNGQVYSDWNGRSKVQFSKLMTGENKKLKRDIEKELMSVGGEGGGVCKSD